jgi:hypothetical protein
VDDATFEGLIVTLTEALAQVQRAVRSIPADRWEDIVHTGDGPWTRRQLLAHMAANDLRQLIRIRIGAGIAQPTDPADHEAELNVHDWNRSRVEERRQRTVDDLLTEMQQHRSELVALLRSLSPEQRACLMPYRGYPTPLADMIPSVIGHLDEHAREMAV